MNKRCIKAIGYATRHYSCATFNHAMRVAEFALDIIKFDMRFQNLDPDDVFVVALLHDIIEDTDVVLEDIETELGFEIANALDALTKRPDEDYDLYIDRLLRSPISAVLCVKKADMKDHLFNHGSLTSHLVEKYLPHIWKFM